MGIAKSGNRESLLLRCGLALLIAGWLLPALALLVTSFRPAADMHSGWWQALLKPARFTLDNYGYVLSSSGLGQAALNSLLIAVPATLLTILLGAAAAYPLALMRFRGRLVVFSLFVLLQIVPIQITLIPVLRLLQSLRLAGSLPGVWLAHAAYGLPFAVFLLHSAFSAVPKELIQSARIDGAGVWRLFRTLLLPLSLPALASLAIFQFLWVWNDLLVALVYLGGHPDVAPLTVRITSLTGSLEAGWHVLAPAAFISMLLPLAVFFGMQRSFVRGMLAGAVKG